MSAPGRIENLSSTIYREYMKEFNRIIKDYAKSYNLTCKKPTSRCINYGKMEINLPPEILTIIGKYINRFYNLKPYHPSLLVEEICKRLEKLLNYDKLKISSSFTCIIYYYILFEWNIIKKKLKNNEQIFLQDTEKIFNISIIIKEYIYNVKNVQTLAKLYIISLHSLTPLFRHLLHSGGGEDEANFIYLYDKLLLPIYSILDKRCIFFDRSWMIQCKYIKKSSSV
jgi:DNA-binding Lrp family transcriptional regulator